MISKEIDKEKPSYPYLGLSSAGTVVLFTAPKEGTAVYRKGSSATQLGEYSSSWTESEFKFYHHKITLEN